MIKETIKSIFKFLEKEENRSTPIIWKIVNNEPINQDDLIVNGDINMEYSNVESLPEGLKVDGFLFIRYTPLVNFSDEELIKMIKPTDDVDGYIGRKIIRD